MRTILKTEVFWKGVTFFRRWRHHFGKWGRFWKAVGEQDMYYVSSRLYSGRIKRSWTCAACERMTWAITCLIVLGVLLWNKERSCVLFNALFDLWSTAAFTAPGKMDGSNNLCIFLIILFNDAAVIHRVSSSFCHLMWDTNISGFFSFTLSDHIKFRKFGLKKRVF